MAGVERNAQFLDCKIASSDGELERKNRVEIVSVVGGGEVEMGEEISANW